MAQEGVVPSIPLQGRPQVLVARLAHPVAVQLAGPAPVEWAARVVVPAGQVVLVEMGRSLLRA